MKLLGNGADRWREAKSVPLNWLGVEKGLAEVGIVPSLWPQAESSPRPAPDLIWSQESIRDLWPSLQLGGVLSPGILFGRKSFNSVLVLWDILLSECCGIPGQLLGTGLSNNVV